MHSHMWRVVLCGFAGFALAVPAAAKDVVLNTAVDVQTTVDALREVPVGNLLPGLHFDANVRGRVMDIYIAPMVFAATYGVKVSRGDYVHIAVTQARSGEADLVLARSITTGSIDKRTEYSTEI